MFSENPAEIRVLLLSGQILEIGTPARPTAKKFPGVSAVHLALGFAAIYLIWGSTYLGIRYAVETIPPLFMMGVRHFVAGVLVYAGARRRGGSAPSPKEWAIALGAGALLFLGGHGILAWAELRLASGLAALLCATLPLWTAIIARIDGTEPNLGLKRVVGILIGFGGVALLIGPDLLGQRLNWLAALAALGSSFTWAVGTAYTRHASLPESKVLSAGMQMTCGGILLLIAGGLSGETSQLHWHEMTMKSVLALAYLTLFGSIIAFTVYTWLVGVSSPSMLSTYAYVNPVIAVFLGWMLAGEALGVRTLLATIVILAGVGLVSTRKRPIHQAIAANRYRPGVYEAAGD